MGISILADIELNQNTAAEFVFESLASAPSSPVNGQVYYDSTLERLRSYEDGSWKNVNEGDAETLDSLDSTQFLRSDAADTSTGKITFDGGIHVDTGSGPFEVSRTGSTTTELVAWTFADTETLVEYTNDDASGLFRIRVDNTDTDAGIGLNANNSDLRFYSDGSATSLELYRNGSLHGTVWHSGNDGASSGLDADLLDAQQGSYYLDRANHTGTNDADTLDSLDSTQFIRSDANDSTTGTLTIEPDAGNVLSLKGGTSDHVYIGFYPDSSAQATREGYVGFGAAGIETLTIANEYGNGDLALTASGTGNVLAGGSRVLTVADEGSGNGLDADTVDGNEASALLARANHTGTQASTTISDFAEAVSDQVGAMVASNTETGIAVTYQDGDNTLDFAVSYGSAPPALAPDIAGAAGVANTASRSDHVHNVPAATAVSISDVSTNAEGNSTSFARANHTHAITGLQATSEKGSANGYASLDSGGKVPSAELPALALTEVHVVADQTARDALSVQEGDVAIVTGENTSYIYDGTSWEELVSPTDGVSNVTGAAPITSSGGTTPEIGITAATTGAAGSMSASDKTKLDGIESGATADQTAADIRGLGFFDTTNDGASSGLDADLLDGQQGSYYLARSNHTGTQTLSTISDSGDLAALDTVGTSDIDNNAVTLAKLADIATASFLGRTTAATGDPEVLTATQARAILNVEDGATADQSAADIRALGFFDTTNDGSGSGLDADLLDGNEASAFATKSGQTYTVTNGSTDRSYNANSTTVNELADVLATLIADLQSTGAID